MKKKWVIRLSIIIVIAAIIMGLYYGISDTVRKRKAAEERFESAEKKSFEILRKQRAESDVDINTGSVFEPVVIEDGEIKH